MQAHQTAFFHFQFFLSGAMSIAAGRKMTLNLVSISLGPEQQVKSEVFYFKEKK